MKRTSFIILGALAGLTACRERGAEPGAATAADTGGTAVVALANDIDVANGLLSNDRYSQEINRVLFLPLLQYNEKLDIAPLLAKSWSIEGDTAVVMQLRNDVRWHDGEKTTAYDVEFTYRYGIDPETGYPNGDYWVGWNHAEVIDSFTIRFGVTPQPELLANLPWIPIMPRHLLEQVAPKELRYAAFNQRPIGNGPFRFVEYRPNDRWVFEANRDYPAELGGRPNLDRIVFRIIPDETAQEADIVSGNVDLITTVRPERYEILRTQPKLRGHERPGRQYSFIAWNTQRPPLNDVRVRRALTMGINRERIAEVLWRGRAQAAAGPVPPFHWSYDEGIRPLPYSPDSARALLAAAGMTDRDGDGFLELAGGKPFRIEMKLAANNRLNRDLGEMANADLAAIGVRLVNRATEFNTMVADVMSPRRNFDAALLGWETDFRLVLHDMFHSRALKNPLQFSSYANAEVDRILDQLERPMPRAAATEQWRRLQTIMRDEVPWTFLYYYSNVFIGSERLEGVQMDIRGTFVNLSEWWVRKPGG